MKSEIIFNETENRYEMAVGDHTVYANVRRQQGTLYIDYVFAPPELRGKGAAGQFMEGLMEIVRAERLNAVPICGYAASWLQRHSKDYSDLMSKA